jgi:hypothetical protein
VELPDKVWYSSKRYLLCCDSGWRFQENREDDINEVTVMKIIKIHQPSAHLVKA